MGPRGGGHVAWGPGRAGPGRGERARAAAKPGGRRGLVPACPLGLAVTAATSIPQQLGYYGQGRRRNARSIHSAQTWSLPPAISRTRPNSFQINAYESCPTCVGRKQKMTNYIMMNE